MIFLRSIPKRRYRDYTAYRSLLRHDFQHRCAYCLMQEFYLGGEAGFCIDHHRPISGRYARPDLIIDYLNLYWCCRECNELKSDSWPSPKELRQGKRFLDPCHPDDDHDLHWLTLANGNLEPQTLSGEYTIEKLKLWRAFLQHHRAKRHRFQKEVKTLELLLTAKRLSDAQRLAIESRLQEINEWLEPPIFDRPRSVATPESL